MASINSSDSVNTKPKKPKPKTMTCGFSDEGYYFESVFNFDGQPIFLVYSNPEFKLEQKVVVKGKEVIPRTEKQTFETMPFVISGKQTELEGYTETKEMLFERIYAEVDAYIDAPREYKLLLALAIMLSYEQEKFNWLPYLGVFGDVESGKSVLGELFATLSYRGKHYVAPTSADIYSFLTEYKDTVPTFVEDEIQGLERDTDKAKIYKSGNSINGCVPRILTTKHARIFIEFKVFCLKMLVGEQEPNLKGLMRRIIKIPTSKGSPQQKWYERTEDDNFRLKILKQKLLLWRMEKIREKYDLTKFSSKSGFEDNLKPFLLLSEDLSIAQEFQKFSNALVEQFQESKRETFEGVLVEAIASLIKRGIFKNNPIIASLDLTNNLIWLELKNLISAEQDAYHPEKLNTAEFGDITKNKVTRTLKDLFNVKVIKIRENETIVRGLRFEREQLLRVFSNYLDESEIEIVKQKLKGDLAHD